MGAPYSALLRGPRHIDVNSSASPSRTLQDDQEGDGAPKSRQQLHNCRHTTRHSGPWPRTRGLVPSPAGGLLLLLKLLLQRHAHIHPWSQATALAPRGSRGVRTPALHPLKHTVASKRPSWVWVHRTAPIGPVVVVMHHVDGGGQAAAGARGQGDDAPRGLQGQLSKQGGVRHLGKGCARGGEEVPSTGPEGHAGGRGGPRGLGRLGWGLCLDGGSGLLLLDHLNTCGRTDAQGRGA